MDFQPISYSSKYVKTLETTNVEQNLPPVAFKLPTFVTHHTQSCLDTYMYTSQALCIHKGRTCKLPTFVTHGGSQLLNSHSWLYLHVYIIGYYLLKGRMYRLPFFLSVFESLHLILYFLISFTFLKFSLQLSSSLLCICTTFFIPICLLMASSLVPFLFCHKLRSSKH